MNCQQCHSPLPADAPGGHCPNCLLSLALNACVPSSDENALDAMTLQAGDRVGNYLILEQIGEGGCGVVFRAAQEQPVQRQVALKVIKPGMDTREFVARFAAERQALAVLDHPNIARIIDAGATETGRPFLVMELVRGLKITDYADQHRLDLPRRLELFLEVCRAIRHAHQKGIIHRDIKPSNILVANDGQSFAGRPRIIDFGIAKSFAEPFTAADFNTAFQHYIGTPAYMSPEQAGLGDGEVDTRTDIYALGVLLYELLAGALPHESPTPARRHRDELLRRIREEEPPSMAGRLAALDSKESTAITQARNTNPPALMRQLRGDLDCIVTKLLEKDRARRYATVSGLIADVENYLRHDPVAARAPGNWYRLQKFARRNRTALSTAGALASLMIFSALTLLYQAVRSERAEKTGRQLREAAQVEADQGIREARFLAEIFRECVPAEATAPDRFRLRQILDQSEARIDRELAGQAEVQADLRITLAETYHQLGLYPRMEAVARKALADSRRTKNGMTVARELEQLGDALAHLGKLAGAESAAREALVLRRKIFGDNSAEVGASLNNLGLIMRRQGRVQEAEIFFRAAIYIEDGRTGHTLAKVSRATGNLAAILYSEGKLAEAEADYRKLLASLRVRFGEDSREPATTLNNLATVLLDEGKLTEAEQMGREAVALDRKFLGATHPDLAISLGNLGNILAAQKSFAEAEKVDRESLVITRNVSPFRPDDLMLRLRTLGNDLACEGKTREAQALFSEAGINTP